MEYYNLPGNLLNGNAALDGSDAESNNNHPYTAVHSCRQEVEPIRTTEACKRLVEQKQRTSGAGYHHGLPG